MRPKRTWQQFKILIISILNNIFPQISLFYKTRVSTIAKVSGTLF